MASSSEFPDSLERPHICLTLRKATGEAYHGLTLDRLSFTD
jgi:hypothetical protein